MKALLQRFKIKYAVLSTLFISIFSGIQINPLISQLIFVGEFYFIYKSYSYFLFFVGIALFLTIIDNKNYNNSETGSLMRKKDLKIITLASLLLIISYMTYMFPLLMAGIFLFFYCLFSSTNYKIKNFKKFLHLLLFISLFFTLFDFLMNFYLSYILFDRLSLIFRFDFLGNIIETLSPPLFTYSLILILNFLIFMLNKVFLKINKNIW